MRWKANWKKSRDGNISRETEWKTVLHAAERSGQMRIAK